MGKTGEGKVGGKSRSSTTTVNQFANETGRLRVSFEKVGV